MAETKNTGWGESMGAGLKDQAGVRPDGFEPDSDPLMRDEPGDPGLDNVGLVSAEPDGGSPCDHVLKGDSPCGIGPGGVGPGSGGLAGFEPDADDDYPRKGRSPLVRLVALLTVLSFLAMVVAYSWPDIEFPPAELVLRSLQLQKDIDVQRLQSAVAKIEVIPRTADAMASRGFKSGTGFNIRPDGLIVTNHHVIDEAGSISVVFSNGKVYRAASWESMEGFDLAVINLEVADGGLPVVPTSTSSETLQSGDKIRIVGNPLGLKNVVVEGKIDRYVQVKDSSGLVFSIDAPVYPGNSGSPVFDRNGEVVGVIFARYEKTTDGTTDGMQKIFGLAVPIGELLKR